MDCFEGMLLFGGRLRKKKMERNRRIELRCSVWKTDALPIGQSRAKFGGPPGN